MKALVVNDDGVKAIGISLLAQELVELGFEVLVVAPSNEQSAKSQAITIRQGIACQQLNPIVKNVVTYAIDATPADCVKFGYYQLNYDFDILFSGVNNGLNLGENIMYSGTVAAAFEAGILNKKAIALSVLPNQYEGFTKYFKQFWKMFTSTNIYHQGKIFNINIPPRPKGYKITHQGQPNGIYYYEQGIDQLYYSKIKGFRKDSYQDLNSDIGCYFSDYISVTPLTIDRTDYRIFNQALNKKS